MSTTATLDSSSVSLAPGEEAVIPVQIRNGGDIVEGYRLEVVGVPSRWAQVDPPTLSLYPGATTTATVTFRPPRDSTVPAGNLQFGVVVTPTEHPDEAVVPEGVVDLLPFLETIAELVPRTSQGSRSGRHQVAVDNRGNVPVQALLEGRDEGNKLRFSVDPAGIVVQPGEAQFATVRARPVRRIWRGAPVTHPFGVAVIPQDSSPVLLEGTFVQQPVIPKWLPKVLAALLALLIALALLWFLLLKPTIESAAKEAAEEEAVAAQESAEQAEAAAADAKGAAGSAEQSAGDASQEASKLGAAPRTTVTSFTQRINVVTSAEDSTAFPVPENGTLTLTDLVLSNPQGDFGRVRILLDSRILFDSALENFRDLDYHFVSPITATEGQEIELSVECRAPGQPPETTDPLTTCDTSAYFGGELSVPIEE